MVGMWLMTLGLFFFLLLGIGLVFLTFKSSCNSEDATRIDPLPTDDDPPFSSSGS